MKDKIELRIQKNKDNLFSGIIKNNEIIAGIAFLLVVQCFNVIISTVRANVAYNILSQYWNHNIHCFVCDKYTRDTEEYKEAYNNFIKK